MNKLMLFIKIIITVLGLILIFTGLGNDSIWFAVFVALVIIFIIFDSALDFFKKRNPK
ncbi:hypothetical protein MHB50_00440 [Siminovitchia sp. FSL H7-0308]|uniref:hypothetical protein n=1 Tax=unclassified Siminovitchia TaxID=2837530 RepID=UPI0030D37645